MLDKAKIERKFKEVQNTQDSIQATALWVTHHRDDAQTIVTQWLSVLRGSSEEQRVTLIHLCNEVVQTCAKRRAGHFKDAFRGVLKEAVALCAGNAGAHKVTRVLTVWRQRSVYDAPFIDGLIASLSKTANVAAPVSPPAHKKASSSRDRDRGRASKRNATGSKRESSKRNANTEIPEFHAETLVSSLKSLLKMETDCVTRFAQLDTSRLLVLTAGDLTSQVRDRLSGDVLTKQYAESRSRLADYVAALEAQQAARGELASLMRIAEKFYEAHLDAASSNSERIRKLLRNTESTKRKLEQLLSTPPPPPPPPLPADAAKTGVAASKPKSALASADGADGSGSKIQDASAKRNNTHDSQHAAFSSDESVYMDLSDDDAEHQHLVRIASKSNNRLPDSSTTRPHVQSDKLTSPNKASAGIIFGAPLDAQAVENMRKLLSNDKSRDRDSSRHRHDRDRDRTKDRDARHSDDVPPPPPPPQAATLSTVPTSQPAITQPSAAPLAAGATYSSGLIASSAYVPAAPTDRYIPQPIAINSAMSLSLPAQQSSQHAPAIAPYSTSATNFGQAAYSVFNNQPYSPPSARYGAYPPTARFGTGHGPVPPPFGVQNTAAFGYQQQSNVQVPTRMRMHNAPSQPYTASAFGNPNMLQPVNSERAMQSPPKRARSGEEEEYVPTAAAVDVHTRRASSNNITLVDTSDTYTPDAPQPSFTGPMYQPRFVARGDAPPYKPRYDAQAARVPSYVPSYGSRPTPPRPGMLPAGNVGLGSTADPPATGVKLPSFITQSQPTSRTDGGADVSDGGGEGAPLSGMPIASLAAPNRRASAR